ncbi:MAG: hypothetical protein DRG30_07065 [Epsilonproteobacteria bacterium]|nr:MAG: hypothetical protein DRG30_07065 [Campylobacterota bacterium]
MSELERIEQLEREIRKLKGLDAEGIPTYSFSKIKFEDLKNLVDIKHNFNNNFFEKWFSFSFDISKETILFLEKLLTKEGRYLKYYNEENLKIKFLSPVLNHINFNIIIPQQIKTTFKQV